MLNRAPFNTSDNSNKRLLDVKRELLSSTENVKEIKNIRTRNVLVQIVKTISSKKNNGDSFPFINPGTYKMK